MKNLWLKIRTNWKKTLLAILGIGVAYAFVEITPPVVEDANPILRTERKFNDSVSIVKRNETETTLSSKWENYYWNGEWLDIDTTLVQTSDGFCADKMPFKFCAPLRSTGEAAFTVNNQYNIFSQKVITDAPLEERMTAVGVNDVAGQLVNGNIMTANGLMFDIQYVLYPGAYNDSDLIYYVVNGSAPRLAQYVQWNSKPTCSLSLTRTFISKYSAPIEFTNFETKERWNKTGVWQTKGEPLDITMTANRGASKRPFHIWDSSIKKEIPNRRRVNVKITTSPGQNVYALTKIIPCDFFTNAVYPVYTDIDSEFSPQAAAGTVTGDAAVQHSVNQPTDPALSWVNLRAAAGNGANDAATSMPITINDQQGAGSNFKQNGAAIMSLNTGPTIPSGDDITSSTLEIKVVSKVSPAINNAQNIVMAGNTGTWTESIVGTDYDTRDTAASSTAYSTYVLYGNINVDDIEIFTLNQTAIDTIAQGSGITRFSLQNHLDMANTPLPVSTNDSIEDADEVRFQSADNTVAPKLKVTHVAGVDAGFEDTSIIRIMYWKLYDVKVALYFNGLNLIQRAYAAF